MKTSSNISTRKLVIGSVAVVVLAAAVFFFTFFQVKTVEVIGNDHYTEDELKNLNSKIMLGRLGEPEEIAAAVCFLASEEAGYITAAMIDVNGGFYIGS